MNMHPAFMNGRPYAAGGQEPNLCGIDLGYPTQRRLAQPYGSSGIGFGPPPAPQSGSYGIFGRQQPSASSLPSGLASQWQTGKPGPQIGQSSTGGFGPRIGQSTSSSVGMSSNSSIGSQIGSGLGAAPIGTSVQIGASGAAPAAVPRGLIGTSDSMPIIGRRSSFTSGQQQPPAIGQAPSFRGGQPAQRMIGQRTPSASYAAPAAPSIGQFPSAVGGSPPADSPRPAQGPRIGQSSLQSLRPDTAIGTLPSIQPLPRVGFADRVDSGSTLGSTTATTAYGMPSRLSPAGTADSLNNLDRLSLSQDSLPGPFSGPRSAGAALSPRPSRQQLPAKAGHHSPLLCYIYTHDQWLLHCSAPGINMWALTVIK